MKPVFLAFVVLLPWTLKRWCLTRFFGYSVHPTARIGFSWIFPLKLHVGPHAHIGHLTYVRPIDLLYLGAHAKIGSANWITGFNTKDRLPHFIDEPGRHAHLTLHEHSAITSRHLIDCTAGVTVNAFATVAGYRSQILTHAIDIVANKQSSAPVEIGRFSFIGTSTTILKGCVIAPFAVVGAGAVVAQSLEDEFTLYGGVPARPIKRINVHCSYFSRTDGTVV
jgi:acetyltransferase-like isoleucine patch superfamily enzyme